MKRHSAEVKGARRHPWLRRVSSSWWLYAITAIAGVAALALLVSQGVQAYTAIEEPYEQPSDYQNVSATASPATRWAENFIAGGTPSLGGFTKDQVAYPRQPLSYESCKAFGALPPQQLLATMQGTSPQGTLTASIYTPGLAALGAADYKNLFSNCWTVQEERRGGLTTTVYTAGDNLWFSYGDVVIFYRTANGATPTAAQRDELLQTAANSLKRSGCLDLGSRPEDASRNLFAVGNKYTGLIAKDKVNTDVPLENIPQPAVPELEDPGTMEEPEGPLPQGLPQMPTSRPEKPSVTTVPTDTAPFSATVSYQVGDPQGPGCGWAWSGLEAPRVNEAKLKTLEEKAYEDAQLQVNRDAQAWVGSTLKASRSKLVDLSKANDWGVYVKNVNEVHKSWRQLNAAREELMTPWYNYVEAHNNWSMFPQRRAEAQRQYDQQVAQCTAEQDRLRAWEEQYGALASDPNVIFVPAAARSQTSSGFFQGTMAAVVRRNPAAPRVPVPQPTTPPAAPAPQEPQPQQPPQEPVTPPMPPQDDLTPWPPTTPEPPQQTPQAPQEPQGPVIPERPAGCLRPPDRPAILRQAPPAEPQPPAIPEGVTIPHSWPRPQ